MEKRINACAVARPERDIHDLTFLAGRWHGQVAVRITNPSRRSLGPVQVATFDYGLQPSLPHDALPPNDTDSSCLPALGTFSSVSSRNLDCSK